MTFTVDDLRNTPEQEATGFYLECHGPHKASSEEFHVWIARMIDMLGPDDCQFFVKSRHPNLKHMWMGEQHWNFEPNVADAKRFEWGEVAVKITNNPKLEAIRIINQNEALGADGVSYKLFRRVPAAEGSTAPAEFEEGLTDMPEFEGRWGMDDHDNHFGHNFGPGGGRICGPYLGQNGEQQPGSTDDGY